jgi:hypothetical protein
MKGLTRMKTFQRQLYRASLCFLVFGIGCGRQADVPAGWDDASESGPVPHVDVTRYDSDETLVFVEPTGDDALQAIDSEQRKTIRRLVVERGSFSDKVVAAEIGDFTQLEEVVLRDSPVGDDTARELAKLPALRVINLPNSQITDDGVAALAGLPHLDLLRVGSPLLTDRSPALLRANSTLRFLHLIDVPLTDEGLKSLHGWEQLESLYLDGSRVTGAGVRGLAVASPDLHMHFDQQHHDSDPNKDHE